MPDANSSVYAQADALSGYTVTAHYLKQTTVSSTNGTPNAVVISNPVDAAGAAKALSYGLAKCGYSQTVTLRAERASGGVTYYQEYRMLLKRSESLQSLSLIHILLRQRRLSGPRPLGLPGHRRNGHLRPLHFVLW